MFKWLQWLLVMVCVGKSKNWLLEVSVRSLFSDLHFHVSLKLYFVNTTSQKKTAFYLVGFLKNKKQFSWHCYVCACWNGSWMRFGANWRRGQVRSLQRKERVMLFLLLLYSIFNILSSFFYLLYSFFCLLYSIFHIQNLLSFIFIFFTLPFLSHHPVSIVFQRYFNFRI